jgi:hypothetical protein
MMTGTEGIFLNIQFLLSTQLSPKAVFENITNSAPYPFLFFYSIPASIGR